MCKLLICSMFTAVYFQGFFRRRKKSFISSIIHWLWHINSLPTGCHNSTSVLQVGSQLRKCVRTAYIHCDVYRNTLLDGLHNFIHLNLAIALILALIMFVSGIETAAENEVS